MRSKHLPYGVSRTSARPAAMPFPAFRARCGRGYAIYGDMMDKLRKPPWCSPDVEFDPTGEQQMGWARVGAAKYRAAHPERYGASPSVTKSVTSPKSVTSERHSVTESVRSKKEKTAERTRRWREKQRTADD